MERMIRFCKRHPLESSLVAMVFSLLLVVSVGSSGAALIMQHQRNQIANEKQVAEKRLGLYRDNVSSMVNYFPQMLDDLPLAQPLRSRLNELTDELLHQQEDASSLVGPSQKWGLVGVAIGKGNLILAEASTRLANDQVKDGEQLLLSALTQFTQAESICRQIVDQRQGDQAKGLSNLALCLSRQAAVKRSMDMLDEAVQLYLQAIEYRQQATRIPRSDTEKPEFQLQADLGREYSNLAELQILVASQAPENDTHFRQQATETTNQAIHCLRQAVFSDDGNMRPETKSNSVRDLAISYEFSAVLKMQAGATDEAAQDYASATTIFERAWQLDPQRHSLKMQLVRSSFQTGDFWLVNKGDAAAAREQYVKGMKQLIAIFTSSDLDNLLETGLAMGYYRLGIIAIHQADVRKAKSYFERCILIRDLLVRQKSDAKVNPNILLQAKIDLLLAQAWAGQSELACQEVRKLIQTDDRNAADAGGLERNLILVYSAAILGICSQSVDEQARAKLVGEAIALLKESKELGFNDAAFLKTDPDFWPLQRHPEFIQFLTTFEMTKQPPTKS
jgi:tetratricopeptide (TPR) repeat protein